MKKKKRDIAPQEVERLKSLDPEMFIVQSSRFTVSMVLLLLHYIRLL